MKAIVLFSGGLDSLLVTKILQEQGFTVIGLNMITPFFNGSEFARARAEELGIELRTHTFGQEYMDMLKKPRWGIGKAVNPCIDCRIMMCQAAADLMKEVGAEFVATGEIAGQRPNSQMVHQLNLIARESGLEGKLVRPLSGKVLTKTVPEREGILSREALHSYTGRFRTGLISLGKNRYNLPIIPQPSTGCLLCEKSFAPRIRDLLKHTERPSVWDALLLDPGRHLRINDQIKCVIGRREADNDRLLELFNREDRSPCFLVSPENFNGPALLMVGKIFDQPRGPEKSNSVSNENDLAPEIKKYLDLAGALILHYSKKNKYESIVEGPIADIQFPGSIPFKCVLHTDDLSDEKAAAIPLIQEQLPPKPKKDPVPADQTDPDAEQTGIDFETLEPRTNQQDDPNRSKRNNSRNNAADAGTDDGYSQERARDKQFLRIFNRPLKKFQPAVVADYLDSFGRFAVPQEFCPDSALLSKTVDRIGIAGAGLMGCSIAASFIQNNISVLLYDPLETTCQSAPNRIRTELALQLPGKSAKEIEDLTDHFLKTSSNLNELGNFDFILETIPEKLKLKQKFYIQLDSVCNAQTVLFSNTSTIKITDLADVFSAHCKNLSADRFCGFHFFHPVRRRSLLEIIRGKQTAPETMRKAVLTARQINKTPVAVNDGPAFLVNRLLNPYLNESMTLLEQGAPLKLIESACSKFGMEMGPFRILDEIGLDVALHSGWTIRKAAPDLITAEEIMIRLIDEKRLGRKSGRGFFQYSDCNTCWESEPIEDPDFYEILTEIRSKRKQIDPFYREIGWTEGEIAARIFLAVLLEAGRILEAGIVSSFELTDMALVLGLGFPKKKGGIHFWAEHLGLPRLLQMAEQFKPLGARYIIPEIFLRQ